MQETRITIINKLGLHARAASKFVSTSAAFSADIAVCSNDKWVD
ncbi:MAG: HPr family phosphocarrier protein, partial [Spongiibacter sp.]